MILRTLTPFLSLVIAVLLYIFVVQPQYAEIMVIRDDVAEYSKATDEYQKFIETLDEKLTQKMNRSALDNERLDALVPDEIEPVELLIDLEALAGKQNMLFGGISVDEGDADFSSTGEKEISSELATADISFQIVGSYEQLKAFLSEVERSLTLFEVTNIKFSATEDSMFGQYAITLRTYALPKS